MSIIWIPDGEQVEVEWYTSEGKAVGVEGMRDHWVAHRVEPKRETGFQPPRDVAYFQGAPIFVRCREARS